MTRKPTGTTKWNSDNLCWCFYDLSNRRWHKQEGKDAKGKARCLSQEEKFLKAKGGKKGKKEGKEEENLEKESPEYYLFAAHDEEEARKEREGGSSSVDLHFQ